MRRNIRKIRLFTVKAITACALAVFVLSSMAIDSQSMLPSILALSSSMWLLLVSWANNWWNKPEKGGVQYVQNR